MRPNLAGSMTSIGKFGLMPLLLLTVGCAQNASELPAVPAAPVEQAQPVVVPLPRPAQNHLDHAMALLQQGDSAEAEKELKAWLAKVPDSRAAKYLLAQIRTPVAKLYSRKSFTVALGKNETLSDVASRYLGNSLAFYGLARYNGITRPGMVVAGERIRVPNTAFAPTAVASRAEREKQNLAGMPQAGTQPLTQMAASPPAVQPAAPAVAQKIVRALPPATFPTLPKAAPPPGVPTVVPSVPQNVVGAMPPAKSSTLPKAPLPSIAQTAAPQALPTSAPAGVPATAPPAVHKDYLETFRTAFVDGHYDEAARAADAGNIDAGNGRGAALADTYSHAASLEKARNGASAAVHARKAGALYLEALNDAERARAAFQIALSVDPSDEAAQSGLRAANEKIVADYRRRGTVALQHQNADAAIAAWNKVLAIDPNDRNAQLNRTQALQLKANLKKTPG